MPPKTERFELRLEESLLSRVDEWADEQQDQLTRAEAIRRLLDIGLSAGSSRSVHFTDGEKMLLIMMGDVFEALKIKSPEIDPGFLAKVIYGGHYWAPKWEMNGVFHDYLDNPEDVRYVVNVLDMWEMIERAFERLSKVQKEALAKEAGPFGDDPKFIGFDGNNESEYMGIAEFLVEELNRFGRFKGRSLNSHSSTTDRYRDMYEKFEPMRKGLVGTDLTVAQLAKLLKRPDGEIAYW